MALVDELDPIGDLVSAHFFGVEEVDIALVRRDVEVPDAKELFTDAVDGLVGHDAGEAALLIIVVGMWAAKEAGHCEGLRNFGVVELHILVNRNIIIK